MMRLALLPALAFGVSLNAAVQPAADYSGAWVMDAATASGGDVYGELRVVRQDADAIRLSMIDYSTAWLGGRFRDVVRIMPWTFRFGEWGPRRGPAASSQPKARARWSGRQLVLGKLTASGNGDFVWVWRLDAAAARLTQGHSARSWSEEGHVEQMGRSSLVFRRASTVAESSIDALMTGMRDARPAVDTLVVRVNADHSTLLVRCPSFDCRVVAFASGIDRGARPLRRGDELAVPIDAEVRLEPVP